MTWKRAITISALGLGLYSLGVYSLTAPSVQAQGSGTQFTCSADDIAATLTLLTGCTAPPDNLKRYVTSIVAQSTTTTGGTFILRYGNSVASGGAANCGTSTVSLIPSAASAARLSAPANTAAALNLTFLTPLVVPANKDLCVLGVATNTFTGQVTGYVGMAP